MKDMKGTKMAQFAYSISLVFKMLICLAGGAYLSVTGGDSSTLLTVAVLSLVFLPLAVWAENQI